MQGKKYDENSTPEYAYNIIKLGHTGLIPTQVPTELRLIVFLYDLLKF